MLDRTAELKKPSVSANRLSQWESSVASNNQNASGNDIEMGNIESSSMSEATKEKWMKAFFEEVENVESGLSKLQARLPQLERLYGKILASFQSAEEKQHHKESEELTDFCSNLAYSLSEELKSLEASAQRTLVYGSADYRMCLTQQVGLSKKLRVTVSQYQDIQRQYREKQKVRFTRQYRIIQPDVSDSEIQTLLQQEKVGPIFAESILSSQMVDEAHRVLTDVSARHLEIQNLSKSIVELDRLFMELSTLVEQQDEQFDQIAYQADSALVYSKEANAELGQAVHKARSARKRKWCLLITCILLVVVAIIVLVVVVMPVLKQAASQ
eukprot:Partr_v1_DN27590_c1_g2_i4_m30527 putative SNARE domain protein